FYGSHPTGEAPLPEPEHTTTTSPVFEPGPPRALSPQLSVLSHPRQFAHEVLQRPLADRRACHLHAIHQHYRDLQEVPPLQRLVLIDIHLLHHQRHPVRNPRKRGRRVLTQPAILPPQQRHLELAHLRPARSPGEEP